MYPNHCGGTNGGMAGGGGGGAGGGKGTGEDIGGFKLENWEISPGKGGTEWQTQARYSIMVQYCNVQTWRTFLIASISLSKINL